MPELSLRERQRQVREDAILDAAHELIMARGYADCSMDDVAAHVGVSKATLYQHFPSKDDLVINMIVRSMRRTEAFIVGLDPRLPPLERLERIMRDAIEKRASFVGARVMLAPTVIGEHPRFRAQVERITAAIGAVIDAGKAEGAIAHDLPTPLLVRLLMNSARADGYADLLASGAYSVSELSDAVVAALFGGLCAAGRGRRSKRNKHRKD